MGRRRKPHQVLGTRELRAQLPMILQAAREEGAGAEPVVGGANRRPEVVIFSYERYLEMMDDLDNLSIQAAYRERVEGHSGLSGRSLEDAARELGFDPEQILSEPPERAASGTRA